VVNFQMVRSVARLWIASIPPSRDVNTRYSYARRTEDSTNTQVRTKNLHASNPLEEASQWLEKVIGLFIATGERSILCIFSVVDRQGRSNVTAVARRCDPIRGKRLGNIDMSCEDQGGKSRTRSSSFSTVRCNADGRESSGPT
jgi:hypothetical protein